MADQFLAEIRLMPYNFAPQQWAFCQGQILPISQNTALFSLVGTYYGGNGTSNFGLPNLAGRAAVHQGQGAGLTSVVLGQEDGVESVTLIQSEMSAHTHTAKCSTSGGSDYGPTNEVWANDAGGANEYASAATANAFMNPNTITPMGGSQPHTNMQPYLGLNYCIALQGIFPARG